MATIINHFYNDAAGYQCIVTSTGGSHADLNADYEALEHEMKHVARCLGGSVLRQTTKTAVVPDLSRLRQETGDRAVLRAQNRDGGFSYSYQPPASSRLFPGSMHA